MASAALAFQDCWKARFKLLAHRRHDVHFVAASCGDKIVFV